MLSPKKTTTKITCHPYPAVAGVLPVQAEAVRAGQHAGRLLQLPEDLLHVLQVGLNHSRLFLKGEQLLVLLLLEVLQELPQELLLGENTVGCQLLLLGFQQFEHELHVRQGHGLKVGGETGSEGGEVRVLQQVGGVDPVLQRVLVFGHQLVEQKVGEDLVR